MMLQVSQAYTRVPAGLQEQSLLVMNGNTEISHHKI